MIITARIKILTAVLDEVKFASYKIHPRDNKAEGFPSAFEAGIVGFLVGRQMYTQFELQPEKTPFLAFSPLLSDDDLAGILIMTTDWVRSHAREIPGFKPLGRYFRFCHQDVEQWLGSLDPLFVTEDAAGLLNVPESWVYANADRIPEVLRLGRYVRFRPAFIRKFLAGSEVVR